MSMNNVRVVVYPSAKAFDVAVGNVRLSSKEYFSSSNAYRGARAAIKSLRNRALTTESVMGSNELALVNKMGRVLAYKSYSKPASAKTALKSVIEQSKKLPKRFNLEANV